jgi:peptide deformylase
MKLKLVTTPAPILFQNAKPVLKIDKKVLTLIEDMQETLLSCTDPVGVGLAAPQVGVAWQLFIIKPSPSAKVKVFINPQLKIEPSIKHSSKTSQDVLEGCLSVENLWAHVSREQKVQLTYTNLQGETTTEIFTGYEAVIIQHEMDHLQGVLFTKRALEQKESLYRIEKQKGKERFVKVEI